MNTAIRNSLEKIGTWIIGITIILGSTIVFPGMSYNYANSKSIVIEIGMAVIIAIGLLIIPRFSLKDIMRSKIVWGWGVFMAISIIATFFSIDPTLSWLSHLERGTGMFFILLTSVGSLVALLIARQNNAVRKAVLYPVVISGAIIGLSTIMGFTGFNIVSWPVLSNIAAGGGLTGNSSYAGTYLMLSSFIIVYLFMTTKKSSARTFLGVLGVLTILNPVMFGYSFFKGDHHLISLVGDARGATISLILGLLISFGTYLSFNAKKAVRWTGRVLTGMVIGGTVIALVLLTIPGNPVHNGFASDASGTRFLYWNTALRAAHDHPIIGMGPETFRYADERYFDSNFARKTYKMELWSDKPHNTYLEILMTTGAVGSVAYLAMIGFLIYVLVRFGRRAKGNREQFVFVASMSGLVFAYLLNNFIFFDTVTSYLVIYLMMGWMAVSERGAASHEHSVMGSWETALRGTVGVAVVIVTLSIVIPEATKLVRVMTEMYAPLETRSGLYAESEAASPYGSGISFSQRADTYSQNYLAHIDEIISASSANKQLVLKDIDAIDATEKKLLARYPASTQGLVALARLGSAKIAIENRLDQDALNQILDSGQRVVALSPTNVQGYWLIAQAYAYEGKYDLALEQFQKALAINPKVPESYQAIIQLAKLTRNQELVDDMTAAEQKNVDPADL